MAPLTLGRDWINSGEAGNSGLVLVGIVAAQRGAGNLPRHLPSLLSRALGVETIVVCRRKEKSGNLNIFKLRNNRLENTW